jgi:two-component system, OmpR family, phosphate regulon sensor histidine kinase PhoR
VIWPFLTLAAIVGWILNHRWWQKRFTDAQEASRKEIAQAAARQQQAAAVALAEKEALFNSMIEGVLVLGQNGRVSMANRALGNLFSISQDIVGKSILEVLRIHELAPLLNRVAKERQVLAFEITLAGIEQRVFEVNASAVLSRNGEQEGTILVFHDLTRIKRLQNTRQEFVANVSHELRTPLSLIKGYIETLLDGAKDKPEVAERFLRTIDRNANRLSLLIEDLLTISQLESGKTVLNFARVDLHQAVDRALEDFFPSARDKRVKLTNAVPPQLAARADANRLHQILGNLLDNAIKYGRADGTVSVAAKLAEDGKIEVSVADDGPGIPPDSLERIFERFYRVDKARSREQGGTGLGLSIVKHIVQSHSGRVWAVSRLGVGSTFFFTLDFC